MGVVHELVEATDPDSAETGLRQFSPDLRMTADADLRHRIKSDGDERFSVVQMAFAGEFSAINEQQGLVVVSVGNRGRVDWTIGDERGRSREPWLQQPGTLAEVVLGSGSADSIVLPLEPLARLGRAMLGTDRFRARFDRVTPGSAALGRTLASAIHHAAAIANSAAFDAELVRTSLYRTVAACAIAAFAAPEDAFHRVRTAEGRRRAFLTAARFLDDLASLPITIEDAAQAAGLPTAELVEVFRGHHPGELTPAQHLRSTRLAAAHEDLLRGEPGGGDRVAVVAYRWGYADSRRFARDYRHAYGADPGTVRRG